MSKVKVKVAQSCLTLCHPMDYRVHGILQARILQWVAYLFCRGSSQTRGQTKTAALQANSLPAEPQGSPRILVWVAYPFYSRSFQPGNWTRVSCIAWRFFTNWDIREALLDQMVKSPPAVQETQVQALGWDPCMSIPVCHLYLSKIRK